MYGRAKKQSDQNICRGLGRGHVIGGADIIGGGEGNVVGGEEGG